MLGGMTKKQSAPMVSSLTLNQTHGLLHKLLDRITELEDRFNQHSENFQSPLQWWAWKCSVASKLGDGKHPETGKEYGNYRWIFVTI